MKDHGCVQMYETAHFCSVFGLEAGLRAGGVAPSGLGHGAAWETRRGSPVDRRPSPAEASPIGQINPFSEMAVTFEPLMGF